MTSVKHEDLLNEVLSCGNEYNRITKAPIGQMTGMVVEHLMAAVITPELKGASVHADAYFYPPDGHCVIPVEVGRTKDGKWDAWTDATDGKPVRVLRVDYSRNAWFVRGRHTDWERDFLAILERNGFSLA